MVEVMRCRSTLREEKIEEIITEDGILCLIVSLLPLREAVRTSVLSRRWRHIWTNRRDFIFDAETMHDDRLLSPILHRFKPEKRELHTNKFIQSVNLVLLQLEGRVTNEIAVQFLLHKAHSHHLDAWVRFAVASKTKKLDLFLDQQFSNLQIEPYNFPCYMIESSSTVQELSLAYCCLKPTNNFGGFNHLTELQLYHVDMTEEDINNLVSNCSALKKFSLWKAQHLVTLSISRPLSQLEFVLVNYCDMLRKIEINAVNLVEIHYNGLPADFIFRQSSKLKVAHIWFEIVRKKFNLDFYLTQLSKNLPHLKSLIFNISGFCKVVDLPKSSYSFMHLMHLDWQWDIRAKMSYLRLATLLDAAPFLQKLKLAFFTRVVEQPPQTLSKKMLPKQPHSYLKAIEVRDFYCDKWQVEIVLFLLNNAIKLESLTIEKGAEHSVTSATAIHESDIKNLRKEVPDYIKLLIV